MKVKKLENFPNKVDEMWREKILHAAKHGWRKHNEFWFENYLFCLNMTKNPSPRIEFKVSRHLAAPPPSVRLPRAAKRPTRLCCVCVLISVALSFSHLPASIPSTARTAPTTSSPPTLTSPTLSVHPRAGNHVVPGGLPREWVAVPPLHMLHPRNDDNFFFNLNCSDWASAGRAEGSLHRDADLRPGSAE